MVCLYKEIAVYDVPEQVAETEVCIGVTRLNVYYLTIQ